MGPGTHEEPNHNEDGEEREGKLTSQPRAATDEVGETIENRMATFVRTNL